MAFHGIETPTPTVESIKEQYASIRAAFDGANTPEEHAKAVQAFDKTIEQAPGHPYAFTNRCTALLALRRFEPALRDAEYIQKHHPTSPDGWALGAEAKLGLGDAAGAGTLIDKAFSLSKANWWLRQYAEKLRARIRAAGG